MIIFVMAISGLATVNGGVYDCSLLAITSFSSPISKSSQMKVKKCKKCNQKKSIIEFHKSKRGLYGVRSDCKICKTEQTTKRQRTARGHLMVIFNTQLRNSEKRKHSNPFYSKEKFIKEGLLNIEYNRLYFLWVKSDYNKNYTPSFDRMNDNLPYSFSNGKWMTWEENNKKGYQTHRNGTSHHDQKAVIGIFVKTKEKVEFHSMQEAERRTGVSAGNICYCCKKKTGYKTRGGFKWEYKDKV